MFDMSLKCVKVDKNWKWFVENGKIALRINDGYKFYSAYRESQIDRALSKPFEFSADDSMYFYHFRECLSDHPYDFLEHHQVALNALTAEHFTSWSITRWRSTRSPRSTSSIPRRISAACSLREMTPGAASRQAA